MTELRPCTGCRRHVELTETTCPFCAIALAPAERRLLFAGRLSRAAVFASATLASAACSKPKPASEVGSGSAPAVVRVDSATSLDAPAPDAAIDAAIDAAVAVDAAPDAGVKRRPPPDAPAAVRVHDHPIPKPYGAPPARRRVV